MSKAIAGKVSDLSDGKLHKVSVEGKEILVVNVGGSYFAVEDTCTQKLNYENFETWNFYCLEPKKIDSVSKIKFASYEKKKCHQ